MALEAGEGSPFGAVKIVRKELGLALTFDSSPLARQLTEAVNRAIKGMEVGELNLGVTSFVSVLDAAREVESTFAMLNLPEREVAREGLYRVIRQAAVERERREELDTQERGKAAEAALKADAAYLSFLSHDLRASLNGVSLMGEVLRRDLVDKGGCEEQLADLEMMKRSGLETVALVDRFLYAERFRRRLVKVRRERVDFGVIGDELKVMFVETGRERDIEISVAAAGVIQGDRALVSLVAKTLVGGAMGRMSRGEIWVKVEGTGEDKWRVEVLDTGPRLLERVEGMLNGTAELPEQGADEIGMRLVRSAAEAMGGRVECESSDSGTRVRVSTA